MGNHDSTTKEEREEEHQRMLKLATEFYLSPRYIRMRQLQEKFKELRELEKLEAEHLEVERATFWLGRDTKVDLILKAMAAAGLDL